MNTPIPLAAQVEFAENPDPRCPCVLLVDTSGSMQNEPIAALNAGLLTLRDELARDDVARRRVEIAIVAFNSEVQVIQDFVTVDQFQPPPLTAGGFTVMGTAIIKGLDMIKARKKLYAANGVAQYRPWIYLITDGQPEGEAPGIFEQACARVQQEEKDKRVAFFAVGVEKPDDSQDEGQALRARLAQIAVRPPIMLKGLHFGEMFVWLSRSMQKVSSSKTSDQVELPPVTWGTV